MVAGYASAGPAAFWLRYTQVRWKGRRCFTSVFCERAASRRQALELISSCQSSLLIPRVQSPLSNTWSLCRASWIPPTGESWVPWRKSRDVRDRKERDLLELLYFQGIEGSRRILANFFCFSLFTGGISERDVPGGID